MTTWYTLLTAALSSVNEGWEDVESSTLSTTQLHTEFDNGYGTSNGEPFTMWTKHRVYFPVVYDGAEWASSVPRNPCNIATDHVGGQ
jgi:hypothetical protein